MTPQLSLMLALICNGRRRKNMNAARQVLPRSDGSAAADKLT